MWQGDEGPNGGEIEWVRIKGKRGRPDGLNPWGTGDPRVFEQESELSVHRYSSS